MATASIAPIAGAAPSLAQSRGAAAPRARSAPKRVSAEQIAGQRRLVAKAVEAIRKFPVDGDSEVGLVFSPLKPSRQR